MNEQLELGELADRLWQRAQSIAGKNEHPELGKLLIVSGSVLSWLPERMSVWRRESWKIVSGSVLNLRSGNSKSRVPNFRACSMRWRGSAPSGPRPVGCFSALLAPTGSLGPLKGHLKGHFGIRSFKTLLHAQERQSSGSSSKARQDRSTAKRP
jgi:hypothetical protein